ncbi:glycine zipper 2TM domain-containing protein [Dyella acidisoli]|uniref:Glycine zipper 2TM domain-containing protein n=1 Tax=Dyella acidisoli TaxID=1867834 RepID=A0ABQ5XJ26_9GAMM|nr:glycine zipper 2TM domain-containing protein [Dyella acidisoli]GLQ91706.1 hypothetical protein GCM10007901_06560 [Dyella acidisoli]
MKKLLSYVLITGTTIVLVVGLGGCNRDATADVGTAGASSAATPAAVPVIRGPEYGDVLSTTPVHKTVEHPRQVCQDVVVNHTEPPKDQHDIAGTAIGAVAGGLLGHMVGHGKGQTVATVVGAVGGGYAGNRIEAAHQQAQVTSTVEHQCNTVNETSSEIVGYDVKYVYNGVTHVTRMDHDPGSHIRLQ